MEAKVTLCSGMQFIGQADSGHAVVMDATAANGGTDSAVRPNELLLIGLAGCTGMDVISILRKKRQPVTGLEMVVNAELTPSPPKRMTSISIEYRIRGLGVDPAAVRRAIELSEQNYCSVGLTLKNSVPIASTFTIEEEPQADPA